MQLLEQRKGDIMSTNNTKTNGGGLRLIAIRKAENYGNELRICI